MDQEHFSGCAIIAEFTKTLPGSPGVYRMLNKKGDILYIGKAKNLKKRVSAYTLMDKHSVRIQRMIHQTNSMEFITTHTEAEALLLEAELIKKLKPHYNILLRDDKAFPYIKVATCHDYPQISKHRGKRDKDSVYFGPFASVGAVNRTLTILQKVFKLRNCTDHMFETRSRPCLQYQIKRCTAPCVDYVSQAEYQQQVQQALDFLTGKSRDIQEEFAAEMERASERLDYETAAEYRDRIRALTNVQAEHSLSDGEMGDSDVMAIYKDKGQSCIQVFFYRNGQSYGNRAYFPRHEETQSEEEILSAFIGQFYTNKFVPKNLYLNKTPHEKTLLQDALSRFTGYNVKLHVPSRGNKKQTVHKVYENAKNALNRKQNSSAAQEKILQEVCKSFDLDTPPKRIEIYDNSHIQGAHAIGAMVVCTTEGFAKNHYRKFNIKNNKIAGDDYSMMREVVKRRFFRAQQEDPDRTNNSWPDLIIIDGGRGQLSAVKDTLKSMGIDDIPLIAVAKGPDRNAGRERFFIPGHPPFTLPHNDPVMHWIQRMRDEAHRFAIGAHRTRRSKNTLKSELSDIPSIGPTRKKALLAYFGSVRAVKQAAINELMKVEGISEKTAKIIYDSFQE